MTARQREPDLAWLSAIEVNGQYVTAQDLELALALVAPLDLPPDRAALVLRDTDDQVLVLGSMGGEGYGLTVMQAENLPVPPFTILGASELAAGAGQPGPLRPRLDGLVAAACAAFGVPARAVGLAVRSSPPVAMPGMLDTLAGLGLTPESLDALADRMGSQAAAWQTLIQQAAQLCRHAAGATAPRLAAATDPRLPAAQRWDRLSSLFTELTGRPYPQAPADQVSEAITAVRDSWHSERPVVYRAEHRLADEPGPSVVVQAMAFGAASEASARGVVFSHNPLTGEPGLFGEFRPAAAGESLTAELRSRAAELYRLLTTMAEVGFAVERGRLWLIRVRPAVAAAHVLNRVCVQAWQDGLISAADALLRLDVDAMFEPLPAAATVNAPPTRPGALLAAAPRSAGTLLCLRPGAAGTSGPSGPGPSGPSGASGTSAPSGAPGFAPACVLDSGTGAALAVPFPDEPSGLPLYAMTCVDRAALPEEADGQLIATGDAQVACEWVRHGGRVVFLTSVSAREWHTDLPRCELAAVVLAHPAQREHARWVLAQRAVCALGAGDGRPRAGDERRHVPVEPGRGPGAVRASRRPAAGGGLLAGR